MGSLLSTRLEFEQGVSRQVRRYRTRQSAKAERGKDKEAARHANRRALLRRQSNRERAGFYEQGPSVAASVSPSRSRINSRKIQKGQPDGRYLIADRFHATKGWRLTRAARRAALAAEGAS